jgi:hypothetical protein
MTSLNWQNTDVMTPEDIWFSVRLVIQEGEATVYSEGWDLLGSATFVDWQHSGESRLYFATLEDGTRWEVVKLKCRCSGAKSGRRW